MGRYVSGDFEYKFWFSVQSTCDIRLFGGYEVTPDEIHWEWCKKDDLEKVKKTVKELKLRFMRTFKTSYDDFMSLLKNKGYTSSSGDSETETDEWQMKCVLAARIDLGEHIQKALEEKEYVYVQAEC